MKMFQPVFVHNSKVPSKMLLTAQVEGFHIVDIMNPGASVHGNNPAIIIYDEGADAHTINSLSEPRCFLPPRNTAVMVLFGKGKGHIRGVPNHRQVIQWFFGEEYEIVYFHRVTGNFRVKKKEPTTD